jgi:hypothetical protein
MSGTEITADFVVELSITVSVFAVVPYSAAVTPEAVCLIFILLLAVSSIFKFVPASIVTEPAATPVSSANLILAVVAFELFAVASLLKVYFRPLIIFLPLSAPVPSVRVIPLVVLIFTVLLLLLPVPVVEIVVSLLLAALAVTPTLIKPAIALASTVNEPVNYAG